MRAIADGCGRGVGGGRALYGSAAVSRPVEFGRHFWFNEPIPLFKSNLPLVDSVFRTPSVGQDRGTHPAIPHRPLGLPAICGSSHCRLGAFACV